MGIEGESEDDGSNNENTNQSFNKQATRSRIADNMLMRHQNSFFVMSPNEMRLQLTDSEVDQSVIFNSVNKDNEDHSPNNESVIISKGGLIQNRRASSDEEDDFYLQENKAAAKVNGNLLGLNRVETYAHRIEDDKSPL
jgi:hypothetical protein